MQPTISLLIEAEDAYRRGQIAAELRRGGARHHHSNQAGRGQHRRWHRDRAQS